MAEEKMTRLEAVDALVEYDHAFLSPKGVRRLGGPFGVTPIITRTDTRSHFKGLNLGPNNKEGDTAEGYDADLLAEDICRKHGIPYMRMNGRGSRLRECCAAIRAWVLRGNE